MEPLGKENRNTRPRHRHGVSFFLLGVALATSLTLSSTVLAQDTSWQSELEEYQQKYEHSPHDVEVLLRLALLTSWNQDYDEALRLYQQAETDAQTPSQKLSAQLGQGEILGWQKRYADAEALYSRMITTYPDSPEPRFRLAQIYSWQTRAKQAKALYEENLDRFATHAPSSLGLAEILSWQGHYQDAGRIYDALEPTEQQNPDYWAGLGRNLLWSNRPLKSKSTLKDALTWVPMNGNLKSAYFEVTQALGRADVSLLPQEPRAEDSIFTDIYTQYKLNHRPQLRSVYTYHTEAGNLDEKLKYNRLANQLSLFPTPDSQVIVTFEPIYLANGNRLATAKRSTYGLGYAKQWTEQLSTYGWLGFGDYSNDGQIQVFTNLSLAARPIDSWQTAFQFLRQPVDESLLSSAGLLPVTGPYGGALVSRVLRNELWWHNTFFLPHRTSLNVNGAVGVDTLYQISDNPFWKLEYTLSHNFSTHVTPRWTHTWYSNLEGRYWHFEDDLLGHGGASLTVLPFGMPLGSDGLSTLPTAGQPGTGGYFSPDRYHFQVIRIGNTGHLYHKRLNYDISGFIGYQDISRLGTDVAAGVRVLTSMEVSRHLSLLAGLLYDNLQKFEQTTLYTGLNFRF